MALQASGPSKHNAMVGMRVPHPKSTKYDEGDEDGGPALDHTVVEEVVVLARPEGGRDGVVEAGQTTGRRSVEGRRQHQPRAQEA